jgi:hypothetical protein
LNEQAYHYPNQAGRAYTLIDTIITGEGKKLFNEAAFIIITEQAPEELPFFVPLRDRYLSDPESYLRMRTDGKMPLAFGSAEILQYVSIAVFPVLSSLLGWLVPHVAEKLAEASAEKLGEAGTTNAIAWLRPMFGREPKAQPLFTTEELRAIAKHLNRIADREAADLGLTPHDVALIRDTLISRLSLTERK